MLKFAKTEKLVEGFHFFVHHSLAAVLSSTRSIVLEPCRDATPRKPAGVKKDANRKKLGTVVVLRCHDLSAKNYVVDVLVFVG